jgi:hypothetical protein
MKKIVFVLFTLCASAAVPVLAHSSKASRVFWNHGFDLAQATFLVCLANGVSAEKTRLSAPLNKIMSNQAFRIITIINWGRALYSASQA